jgi:hypothetical protein
MSAFNCTASACFLQFAAQKLDFSYFLHKNRFPDLNFFGDKKIWKGENGCGKISKKGVFYNKHINTIPPPRGRRA